MGALRDFKNETGYDFAKDASKLDTVGLAVMLYCALRSACRIEDKKFDVDLDDFLDNTTPEEISAWYVTEDAEAQEISKKK